MAPDIAADSFLDLLRQSSLVPDDQLLALLAEFRADDEGQLGSREMAKELVEREILTQWQADMLLQGKHRGFRLGPHRILRPLGQGGMSKVFLAEHEMMRRRCAIKVLPSKYQEDPDLLGRFHLEARAIAALDHPHIVRAYDFNKDVRYGKEIHYLVMEYVEGQDLRRMVEEEGPLEYHKAADLICQAAEGLAHAHESGFVHRDVKPANLLVDTRGVLKILDLGLARFTFEGEEAWQTAEGEQSAVGTADYVSPEQVVDSRNVNGCSDIYSLGYTFYFILTGRRPFPKATLVELLMAHRVEKPEPISKFRPDAPLELTDIIDRMTAKKPAQRYQTAEEVAKKLQAWLRDSAGGQGYSRISALVAAAMRAKQPSGDETSQEALEFAKSAELELAFLDEEASSKAKNAEETNQAETANFDAADTDKTLLAKKSAADQGKKSSLPVKPSTVPHAPQPTGDDKKTTPPKIQSDLLSELLSEDLLAAAPPPVLASDQSQRQHPLRLQPKPRGGAESILQSPWLWVGLASLVVVVILLLVVMLAPSPPTSPDSRRPVADQPVGVPLAPPAAPKQDPQPSGEPRAESPAPPPPAPPPPAPQEPTKPPEAPVEQDPPVPSEQEIPPPVEEPKPTPPPEPSKPAPPEAEKPVPETPAIEPINRDKLLAELTSISYRFQSTDNNPKRNLMFQYQAREAGKHLKLADRENSPNVMEVQISTAVVNNKYVITISAELKCPGPNEEVVTVWKRSKAIASLDPRAERSPLVADSLRGSTIKFFNQFIKDVNQARTKAKSK